MNNVVNPASLGAKKNLIFKNFKWLLVPLVLLTLNIGNAWGGEETFSPSSSIWSTTGEEQSYTHTGSGITLATSSGCYNEKNTDLRVYKDNTFTVSISSGNITAITMTGVSRNPISGYVLTSGGGSFTTDGNDGSWSGSSSTVVFTASTKQVRMKSITVTYASASCSNYSFHYGTKDASDWCGTSDYCFTESTSDGNGGKFWLLEDFTMPAKPDFYVGYQGSFDGTNAKSKTLGFGTIPFDLQRTKTIGTYDGGNTQGAIGILRIRSSYGDDNKYIGFIPGGYVLRLGSGDSWTSYALTAASADYYETVWTTDIMTLTAGILGGNAYVGLKTASSYVWNSTYSQSNAINGNMGQKSGAGDSWGSNLSSSTDVGKRGKFRIWADNTAKNWNLHFVPYHRIIYHANYPVGDSPADTYSTDVSVEETKSDIALPSAPTAPTGYTFAGWYDAASGGTQKTGNQTISAGASADPEYYAHWYGITLVVKDEDGTTLSGDGKPTLTRTGLSLTATTAGNYVFKDIQITSGTGTLSSTSSTTPTITAISSDITVTATFYKPIAVTKGTNTGAATFTLSATEVARGGNVTITCAADASHKGNPIITATSGNYSTISVASATSASVNGITGPVTINISYTAKETATVKLHVAGSTSTISGTRYEGDSYTLPSEVAECPDMGLYGWYTTDYEHATTAPSGANFKLPGASATLAAGDNDFYAVYATVTPDAADTYTKITSTGELVTGDYLIVGTPYSTMYAMKNAYETSESTMADESRTVTDNQITNPASTKAEYIWHFTKSNSTITIYSANSSKYFGFSSNHVALMNSSQNLTYEVSDGKWAIYSGSDYLTYSSYFQRGASKVYQTYLFKRDPSVAGPYTTTPSCTTHSLSTAVTPVSTGTAEAGKTVIGEGKTTTVTASPEEGYAFRYWTISGEGSTMSNTSDGKSTDNPVTVTMGTADATITAHFAERVAITFNVPTGVTKPSNSYTDVALPTPSGFPSAVDDDCWAFAGWTESSSVNSTSAPATLYPAGSIYSGSQESAFTLYAVYSRNKYLAVYNSSLFGDLTDYVITYAGITNHEYALTGVADDNDAEVLDVIDNRHDKVLSGLHYYTIDNPSETAVWTLSGSSGSWVLQNKATGKYLDLSSTSSPMISGSSATMAISGDDMDYTFTKSGNKLVITSSGASVGTGDPTEDEEFWLYKLSSSKYMTTPAEPTYTVTWKVAGESDQTTTVNACEGLTAAQISALTIPSDDYLEVKNGGCITNGKGKFMGWSTHELGSESGQSNPGDLFKTYDNAPYLTGDLTVYAVFAEGDMTEYAYDLNNSGSINSNWEKTTTRSAAKNDQYAGKQYTWQVYGENSGVLGELNTASTYTNVSGFKLLVAASTATTVKLYYSANKSDWVEASSQSVSANSSSYTEYEFNVSSVPSTAVYLKITNSVNSLYIKTATITTGSLSNYRTTCCSNKIAAPSVTDTKTAYTITLTWPAVTSVYGDASSYEMQWNGGDWATVTSPVEKTSLTPNTSYSWKVRVKTWTGEYYCAANEASGGTTTNQVYTVTYNANGGTVTTLPSGGTYEEDDEVTVANKPGTTTKSGCTFTGWNTANDGTGEHYDADGSTTFDMPADNVVLYAEWTTKKNYFIDRMHGNWDGEHTEPTTGYNCYLREGAGYTVPDLSDDATGSNSCVSGHAYFIGWVIAGKIGAQGQLLSGYTVIKGGTVQTAGTDGTIYYAVWAEE